MPLPKLAASPDEPSRRRDLEKAAKDASRGQLEVFRAHVDGYVDEEITRIETMALASALKASLDAEVGLLDYGLTLAEGNPAVIALTSRKVTKAAAINDARIDRRFRK